MNNNDKRLYQLEKRLTKMQTMDGHGDLGDAFSSIIFIPELRGFWPYSSIDENGAVRDVSGQNRLLAINGSVGRTQTLAVPYASFPGGGWYSRADEAGLDITGAITWGGWFYLNNFSDNYGLMAKDGASGQRSYLLTSIITTGQTAAAIFPLGTSASAQTIFTDPVVVNTWNHIVARFTPSTELAVFLNGVKFANTTSIGASTFNSTSPFNIAAVNGGQTLQGNAALSFISASSVYDSHILNMFNSTRWIFGV